MKVDDLSYGRLMGFDMEIVDDFFKLSRQTMEDIKVAPAASFNIQFG
jgi:hypothetical protein